MQAPPAIITNMAEEIEPTTAAYLAGLFDGEGSVRIRYRIRMGKQYSRGKVYPHRKTIPEVKVAIGNRNKECLELCRAIAGGGRLRLRQREGNWSDLYTWETENRKAVRFLEVVRPYVIIKRPHLEAIFNHPRDRKYASEVLRVLNKRGRNPETSSPAPLG